MKIEQLHIKNFGHFRNYSLPLGQNKLTIIYGENEAGKSTLTHFFKHLMLGMPGENKYQYYLSGSQKGGYGEGKLDSGIAFKLASYKRKQRARPIITALNPNDQISAEERFNSLIKTIGDQVYKNLFACTTEDFHNTSKFLKEKDFKEFLSQFLIGGQNPKVLIKSLNSQAEEYFNTVKGKKKLKKINENIGNLKVKVSAKELKSSDYYEKKEAFETAKQKCQTISKSIDLKKQRVNLLKLCTEWLIEHQRHEAAQIKIASFAPPSNFPPAGLSRMQEQLESLKKKEELLGNLEAELHDLRAQSKNLTCKRELIAQADQVKYLEINSNEAIRLIKKNPELKARSEEIGIELQQHLNELGSDWNQADLNRLQISAVERNKLDSLAKISEELAKKTSAIESSLTNLIQKQKNLAVQKSAFSTDMISQQELQTQEDIFNNQILSLIPKQEDLATLYKLTLSSCESQFKELAYEATEFTSLDALVASKIPDISQIEEFASKLKNIGERQGVLRANLIEIAEKKARIQRTINIKRSEVGIMDLKLPELRETRELRWKNIKKKISCLEQGTSDISQSHPNLAIDFEEVINKIDFLTDKIMENHELVAMERELVELIAVTAEKNSRLYDLSIDEKQLLENWHKLWEDLPLTPMLPHLMLDWRKSLSKLRADHSKLLSTREQSDEITNHLQAWVKEVQKYLKPKVDKLSIKERFRAFLAEQNRMHTVLEKLEQENLEITALVSSYHAELSLLQKKEQKIDNEWTNLCINFFPNKNPIQVNEWSTFISTFEQSTSTLDELKRLHKKIKANDAEIISFTRILRDLCQIFNLTFHENSVQISLDHIFTVFEENAATNKKIESLKLRQKHIEENILQQSTDAAYLKTQITSLLKDAQCKNQQEFLKAGKAYQDAVPYLELIQNSSSNLLALESKIKKINIHREELSELQTGSLDSMQVERELHSEESESKQLELELKETYEDLAKKKLKFNSLDGSEDVSYYQSEITSKESEFKEGFLDYLSLKLGAKILTRVLENFESKTHPEFIKLASSYLSDITSNKYQEIGEDEDEYYIEGSHGNTLAISELSTGTLEQLYLSMRLAAMEQLASKGETLPFVLDDILANSDYKRASRGLRAISKLSHKTQIIYLTCHARFIETVKSSLNYGSYNLVHLSKLP
ncbi:MAG: AAA family ATPase [Oligoflexales bacterium]